ncbi:uncharacterized protein LOC142560277 isoform X2 [Dermacentor variabilis]|uniref:uncharacterized protein LOC142560277 isoform X2 n=1 Tax=Dermacentor variabilis TaxID=34621 RepID=UPI003F5BA572
MARQGTTAGCCQNRRYSRPDESGDTSAHVYSRNEAESSARPWLATTSRRPLSSSAHRGPDPRPRATAEVLHQDTTAKERREICGQR